MWISLAVNAVMLVGLLFTLWRLHQLQAVLAIQRAAVPVAHYAVKPADPRRRESPRRSALDEFPSETGLEDAAAPASPRRPHPSPAAAPIDWRRAAADLIRRSRGRVPSGASSSSSRRGRFV
jgi:hypothetical protein